MTHRFPLKEIARQAGLGTATVDRAINNRAHVSAQTKARVTAAIAELEGQETQLVARGRRMFFDFVIEAPTRFSREVQRAAEVVLPQIGTAVCRPRFLAQEIMSEEEILKALARIAKRGSHGVCIKARDLSSVRQAVDELVHSGIPVVTLVTDINAAGRIAYVGLDNQSAGRTAAYLIASSVGNVAGTILAMRSNARFLGEEERATAFAEAMAIKCPKLLIVDVSGGSGVHFETSRMLDPAVEQLRDLKAVYSMGGGNRSILDVLKRNRLRPKCYVAHDLDRENRDLIQDDHLNFVLHHDLKTDMQNVFQAFLHYHRLVAEGPFRTMSNVQVVTPMNVPPEFGRFR